MLSIRFDIVGRLFLAATILFAGVRTPAICHAHSEGEHPHDHQNNSFRHQHSHAHRHGRRVPHDHSHHGHQHPHTDRHQHRASKADVNKQVGSSSHSVRHVHVSIWGLDVTLPSPVGHEESTVDQQLETYFLAHDSGPATISSFEKTQFSSLLFSLIAFPCTDSLVAALERPPFSNNPVLAPSLCDTARHERSGVQLS